MPVDVPQRGLWRAIGGERYIESVGRRTSRVSRRSACAAVRLRNTFCVVGVVGAFCFAFLLFSRVCVLVACACPSFLGAGVWRCFGPEVKAPCARSDAKPCSFLKLKVGSRWKP